MGCGTGMPGQNTSRIGGTSLVRSGNCPTSLCICANSRVWCLASFGAKLSFETMRQGRVATADWMGKLGDIVSAQFVLCVSEGRSSVAVDRVGVV